MKHLGNTQKKQPPSFTKWSFICLLILFVPITVSDIVRSQSWNPPGNVAFSGKPTTSTSLTINSTGIPYVVYSGKCS